MNRNESLTLWISIAAGVFAAFLIFSYTQEKTKEISKVFGINTSVVVATQYIQEMATVQESMVELVQMPAKFVQPGHVKHIEEVVGLVALAPIDAGEQILINKVIVPGPETGLSIQVSPGNRAITIPINDKRAVAKLLKPGDRVDMLVALDLNTGGSQKRYIKTLMQDVVILATGTRVMNELPRIYEELGGQGQIVNLRMENKFSNITIEATPEDSQKIVYLLSTSPESIFFTLRHPSDNSFEAPLKQVELADLLGGGIKREPAQNKRPNLTR